MEFWSKHCYIGNPGFSVLIEGIQTSKYTNRSVLYELDIEICHLSTPNFYFTGCKTGTIVLA